MQKTKIMIVDDDKDFLEELKETFLSNGYDAVVFSDGDSALKEAPQVKPDIVLLDLKMKNKSGFQIADELKYIPETAYTPIIAMSAFYSPNEQCLLMDVFKIKSCLIKPFDPVEAIANIETALKKENG